MRLASSCKLDFRLPMSTIRATFWLSVYYLTDNPASLSPNDCKTFLTANISRIVEFAIAKSVDQTPERPAERLKLNNTSGITPIQISNSDYTGFQTNATRPMRRPRLDCQKTNSSTAECCSVKVENQDLCPEIRTYIERVIKRT